jgi:hypothetical protein
MGPSIELKIKTPDAIIPDAGIPLLQIDLNLK